MFTGHVLYHMSHYASPFFVMGVFEIGFPELFALVGFELQSPDLCLLSS
jgi:hypothetical protein